MAKEELSDLKKKRENRNEETDESLNAT